MKIEEQLQLQAYLDNELSAGDARKVASLISTDPAARALFQELKDLKDMVTTHEPVMKVEDSRDFYWSQIARRIESEGRTTERLPKTNWFVRWVAPLAGACAVVALSVSLINVGPKDIRVDAVSPYGPPVPPPVVQTSTSPRQIESPEMSTITFHSESEGMTVVWISNDI